jgi:hypothetical protein
MTIQAPLALLLPNSSLRRFCRGLFIFSDTMEELARELVTQVRTLIPRFGVSLALLAGFLIALGVRRK